VSIRKLVLLMIVGLAICAAACGSGKDKVSTEPSGGSDPFFEKARLIMTPEEVDIYKHLPDQNSKDEFIEEFWSKRNPSPVSSVNPVQDEFELRIEYANKWFNEGSKNRGWDTERGRILLLLGFPDSRQWGETTARTADLVASNKKIPMEYWTYYDWGGLTLVFAETDDSGRLRLQSIPTNLQTAMDFARFSLDLRDKQDLKHAFKFSVDFRDGNLNIVVPTKKVNFEEKDGKMNALFYATVYIYCNGKKQDVLKQEKSLQMEKDELLKLKKFQFTIPYSIKQKGKYYFDIVIEDKNSGKRYRNFASFKKG
jgi:GWxTD domain-containing protein